MSRLFILLFIIPYFKTEAQTSVLNVADSLYAIGNHTKAIQVYNTLKDKSSAYNKIAKAYMAIGNYDEALKNYKLDIEANPKDVLALYDYAKLLSKTKKYSEAVIKFKDLIAIDSLNPNYHYELGLVFEAQNDSLDFYEYKKTFRLDSTHQKAIYKIAKQFLQKRKYDSVQKYTGIGLKTYENNVELISLKAQNYYWQHYYREAIPWFEKLITLGESSQFIHEKLSNSYSINSQYEKAIEHLKLALDFEPKNTKNLYILAKLYSDIQDFENAEKCYLLALEIDDVPLDDEYTSLGIIYNRQDKHKEAIAAFQKSLKENPENEAAAFFLVYTQDKYYKDIDTRIDLYTAFKKQHPGSLYIKMVDLRISELKEEKFMKAD